MKPSRSLLICMCTGAALALAASQTGAQGSKHSHKPPPATTSPLHVGVVNQPRAPTNAELAAFAGPNPTGLQSAFPAGLPQPGAGFREGVPPPDRKRRPGHGPDHSHSDGLAAPVLAAAARGYGGVAAEYGGIAAGAPASPRLSAGSGHAHSTVEIAKSFIEADANRDGELTRAEAQRLAIMPYSFEEMDRNFDGVISRFEYEDATR